MAPRTTRLSRTLGAAACVAALGTASCRSSTPATAPEPAVASDPCILPTSEAGEPRELVVAAVRADDTTIVTPIQPEPLIRLDCTGAARPGAAESWTPDSSRHTWTLVLAPSATGITASAAAAEWRTRPDAATAIRFGGVVSVVPLDDRRLAVTFERRADSVPALFADPSLALATDSLPRSGTTFVARRTAGDPRDALDAGADILRTGDPALLEYARSRSDFMVHQLPWSRTYLLVVPPGDSLPLPIPLDSTAFRAELARDAVPVEARGAERPWWWEEMLPCPTDADTLHPVRDRPATAAVVYDREDAVARALAERVVALSDDPRAAASALPAHSIPRALYGRLGGAYIVAVPRTATAPCREAAAWPAGSTLIPLVDTRMGAIVRRGVPWLTVEYDGRLRPAEEP
jgi:hypothetical protein